MANIIAKPPTGQFLRSSPYGPWGYILLIWNVAPFEQMYVLKCLSG